MVDTLVAIHAVDPDAVGLGELARRSDYVARQLRRWRGQWDKQHTRELALIEEVGDRLAARIPEQGPATIVHGDYRLDNMILTAGGEVAAVVDWELATLGDPLADVGMLLVYWGEDGDQLIPLLEPATMAPGFLTRDEVARRYADRSGRDLSADRLLRRPRRSGSWRSSSRGSSPATRPASTARPMPTRGYSASRAASSASPGPPTRRSGGCRSRGRRAQAGSCAGAAAVAGSPFASRLAHRVSSRRAITILCTSSGPSATFSIRE